jgi:PAS domain S-box-containing protein
MVLVGLLPLILSLLLTYFEEQRALRETAGINFKGMAVEVARKVETQIVRGINEAQQLATIPFIRSAVIDSNRSYADKDADEILAHIQEWQERWRQRAHQNEFPVFINQYATNYLTQWHAIRNSDYLAILVVDNQGALVLSSFPQVKFFHGTSPWFQAVLGPSGGQIFVSDLFFDPSFGTHVLNVVVPMLDDQRHDVVGAISILLRRDSLFRSISEVTAGSTGHAMLVASDGTPLLCPVLSLEEHAIQSQLVQALAQLRPGWLMANPDSHGASNSIVGFAPLHLGLDLAPESFGGHQWHMLVRQDPSETYAPLNQLLIKVASYGVAVFVILWGTGIIVAGRIVKPIQALYDGVQRIGRGNLKHHLEVKTGDEIERLAEAFNTMAGNLQHSFTQLNHQMTEIGRLEEKYRDLIENSPEMIHQIDPSGRFVHVNQTELDKLGYTLEEMLNMSLVDIVPAEKISEIHQYLRSLEGPERRTIETVFLTRNREPIEVEMHSTILTQPQTGSLIYSRGFVRDITDRKKLQRELERYTTRLEQEVSERTRQLSDSETRYKALFNHAADSILMVDEEGKIEAVNEREYDALGYTLDSLIGKPLSELVLPGHQGVTLELLQKVREGEQKVSTREIEVYDASQVVRSMEIDLIRVSVGKSPSVMVQLRDIAQRKRLEEQLHRYSEALEEKVQERTREIEQAKQYIESLLENANDVIYTLDSDLRFTYVNSKVKVWGYQKEDLIGRPYLSLISKRYRGRYLRETLDIGTKQVYEVEMVSQDGKPRSVLVSVSPLRNEQGVPVGVLGIARDITERKLLEQQVRDAERLASIGQLAAGVAHEINNPLGGILNCLFNLRKGTLSPGRAEEYTHFMEDGLRRVQKIVRQLLDFSQQHKPELRSTDINTLVDRVLVLTNHTIAAKQLTLHRECEPGLPPMMVDPHMIEQVLMNLILNAVQATQEGGTVTIRTRQNNGTCEIDVEDTGCGIPPEVRSNIFDPFFTTKRTGEGTGLGLSVSLGIVERHGGEMLVESEIEKGTKFTVRLPFVPSPSLIKVGT